MKDQTKIKVGLDIGSFAVKVLVISDGDKPNLIYLDSKKISGLSNDETADAVKSLMSGLKVSAKDVNISVSGSAVIIRFISMPRMNEEDLKSAVRFEAEKFIPFNINDCILDFQTLRKDDSENKSSVLLVAAKKDYIQQRIAMVAGTGFSVAMVDGDSFALVNSFLKNSAALGKDKTLALLNIGASITNLSILKNGIISFVRDVAMGGNDFNAAISKSLNIAVQAAEDLKLDPKDRLADVKAAVRPVLNSLLDEVKLSFSYYENQGGGSMDDIYVSGGSSGLSGLDELFEDIYESKPRRWNPLEFLNTGSSSAYAQTMDRMKHSFAVCAGLVLR